MAVRCALVILGSKTPFVVEEMSKIDWASGAVPVELIDTA
jgi:hypothetical protein